MYRLMKLGAESTGLGNLQNCRSSSSLCSVFSPRWPGRCSALLAPEPSLLTTAVDSGHHSLPPARVSACYSASVVHFSLMATSCCVERDAGKAVNARQDGRMFPIAKDISELRRLLTGVVVLVTGKVIQCMVRMPIW